MTDQRADTRIESLDERVAEALRNPDEPTVEHRRRRFGAAPLDPDPVKDPRVEQHELRLDALTSRISTVALRAAALQTAHEGAMAPMARTAEAVADLGGRVDDLVIEQMEAHAAHELTVKLVADLVARLDAAEHEVAAARADAEARADQLAEAVDALTKKVRAQAGQLTKLRNQLKLATAPPPPTPAARRRSAR